jgi:hypothetical protein
VAGRHFTLASPPRWAFAVVALIALGFLLRVYVGIWTPEHGITKFLRVGREFDDRGTKVFRETPKFIDPYPAHRWGFDGQLYAEMALDPLLLDPQLHAALDNPPYRAQRILLSWIAWVLGLGKPFWVLNAFAAINLLFWIGFAWLAGRLFSAHGWPGLAGYAAVLVTCGVIESMQASLMAGGTAGAGLLALAALVRSTSLIGFIGLAKLTPPWGEALRRNIKLGLIAAVPLAIWVAYVLWRFRGREVNFDGGNLDLPFRGMMQKLGEFSVTAVHGPIRWHRFFFELYKSYDLHVVLTIVSVVTQTIFIALHRQWRNPLWLWGAVTAAYFSCISFLSWESHFTITRHALPMTLVFNLLLAMRPSKAWVIWFLLGNCFVPFGVRYFDGMREFHSPPPLPEFVIEAPASIAEKTIEVRYGDGWSSQQWWPDSTWRWARGERATIVVRNASTRTVRADFKFIVRSFHMREFEVALADKNVLRTRLGGGRRGVALKAIELPPGETVMRLTASGATSKADDGTPGEVTIAVENPRLEIGAP